MLRNFLPENDSSTSSLVISYLLKSSFRHYWILLFFLQFSIGAAAGVVYSKELKVIDYKEGFKLEWTTISEVESELFVIERSLNGIDFENIGTIKAAGNSATAVEYTYSDLQLGLETAYYRLRQTDFDGSNFLSEIQKIEKFIPVHYLISGIENEHKIFLIYVESVVEGELTCILQSLEGEIMRKEHFMLQKGLNEYRLDLDSEKEGNYSLVLKNGSDFCVNNLEIKEDPEKKKDRLSRKESTKGW